MLKLFFEITEFCNFRCVYCFSVAKQNNFVILPIEKFEMILKNVASLNKEFLVLLEGGEPLSVDNLFDYAKHAKKFTKHVMLGTNGSLIKNLNDTKIRDIKRIFGEVSISLDSLDKKLFKNITNFPIEPTLQGIDIFAKSNINIKICCVLTSLNSDIKNLQEILNFCENKRISKLRFYWFVPREYLDISLRPNEDTYHIIKSFIDNYKGNVNVKLSRYYEPKEYFVVTASGEIKTFLDSERINPVSLGNECSFLDKYKSLYENNF